VTRTVGRGVYVLGPGVRLGGLDLRDRLTRDAGGPERLKVGEGTSERVRGDREILTSEREAKDLKVVGDLGSYEGGSERLAAFVESGHGVLFSLGFRRRGSGG
jgi:hypothetical protein